MQQIHVRHHGDGRFHVRPSLGVPTVGASGHGQNKQCLDGSERWTIELLRQEALCLLSKAITNVVGLRDVPDRIIVKPVG